MPGIVIGVERVHEEHFVSDLFVACEPEVEINLFVVLPQLRLLVRLLQLVVPLLRCLALVLLVFRCRLGSMHLAAVLNLHLDARLAVYPVDDVVALVQVALYHLDLREWLAQLLVVAVTIEDYNLKVL